MPPLTLELLTSHFDIIRFEAVTDDEVVKERSSSTVFIPQRFFSFAHSGPLVFFSMISWHQRRRRRKPRVISHLSLVTRATFRCGDVPKSGVSAPSALALVFTVYLPIEIDFNLKTQIPITIGNYTVTSAVQFLLRNFALRRSCIKENLKESLAVFSYASADGRRS